MGTNISFSKSEKFAVLTLSLVYGLRMFGLFLIMPVIAIDINSSSVDNSAILIGLVIGIYGLTQAIFQIPFGLASDKFGRKPIIVLGLLIFTAASYWAANANDIQTLIFARAIQGVGAVSAAASAFLADLTRDEVRSKAMGMVGISIGLSFVMSLVFAPVLYVKIGLNGLFYLVSFMGLIATILVLRIPVPLNKSKRTLTELNYSLKSKILNNQLLRLYAGIFFLMFTQASLFLIIPNLIQNFGIQINNHWKLYLPVLLLAFVIMYLVLNRSEHEGNQKKYYVISILLVLTSLVIFSIFHEILFFWVFGLCVYFVGFNLLEAFLPSWVSKIVVPKHKGLALGIYNTGQSLGIFFGGLIGGVLYERFGEIGILFFYIFLLIIWFYISLGLEERIKISKIFQPIK